MDNAGCYTTDAFGFFSDDRKVAADWFGPLHDAYPSKPLFGGLDPKRPDYCPIPTGAVFDWDDRHEGSGLSSLVDSWSGFGSNSCSAIEFKTIDHISKKNLIKKETAADSKLPHLQGKANETHDFKERNQTKSSSNVEKKKRGRPRLELVQARQQERQHMPVIDLENFNLSAYALTDRPSALYNSDDDDLVTVGCYTKAVRRQKIERFKAKKRRTLQYGPFERYGFRKMFAGTRPRVGGRFVKMESPPRLQSDSMRQYSGEGNQMMRQGMDAVDPFFDSKIGMLTLPQEQPEQDFTNYFSPSLPELEAWPSVT